MSDNVNNLYNLSIISAINDRSYGLVGTNVIHELIQMGVCVSLFPIGQPSCLPKFQKSIKIALDNVDNYDRMADCIRVWHQHDLSMFVGHGQHIGFPIFELDTFTKKEKHQLESCDKLFVCSKWAQDIIIKNLGVKWSSFGLCEVVPLGVDTSVFYPNKSGRAATVFLNCGKWECRKGHDVLLDMFCRAFTPSDNVELWMMCHNPFLMPQRQAQWESTYKIHSTMGNKIRIIPWQETDDQVADIFRQVDCGVFPSRAEGWNLEALELLACGKQLIITNYSAHTEFCDSRNSWLVCTPELEIANDGIWFHGQGKWAKITTDVVDQFVEYMRYVHKIKQNKELGTNDAGVETAKQFSWRNTAEELIKHLQS